VNTTPSRQRLIEEASKEFVAHGFGGANVDRIAEAARISKKTLYKVVSTKAELFILVVGERIQEAGSPDLMLKPDEADPRAALRKSLLALADLGLSPGGLAAHCLVMREGANFPELLEANNRPIMPYMRSLIGWLAEQTRRGWLKLASPEWAANMLVNMVLMDDRRNAMLGLAPPPDAATRARRVDQALELFLNGALAKRD
jgi:TetR/AcrR family transcriptional repressor of mexJK operon